MAATITLQSPTGTIIFSEATGYDPPLVSRRLDWNRLGEQGNSIQRVTCELSGFFTGNSNADITLMIDTLMEVLRSNTLLLTYNDGARNVLLQKRCYIVGYGDPMEWKEYTGDYSIALYYFQEPETDSFEVSWQPSFGSSYSFDPAPTLARAFKPLRGHPNAPALTPTGLSIGSEITIQLEGQLFADTPEDLETKRLLLEAAFSYDGTLNYGGFYSQSMRIAGFNIPPVFPMNWMTYTMDLTYSSTAITEFRCSREFSMTHQNPLVRENIMCASPPTVTLRNTSGQYVTYTVHASGYDISVIREFLANELALLVYPNGTLMQGGSEKWNEYGEQPSVDLSFTKFHTTAVVANL